MRSTASRCRRPLDADGRGLAEVDLELVVGRERRLDDLLLDLAVEGDRDLLAHVVLAKVDERVLLGKLGERDVECAPVARAPRHDYRFERRRSEVVALGRGAAPAEVSPIWTSASPHSLPICPAWTDAAGRPRPGRRRRMAVIFAPHARRARPAKVSRSRARTRAREHAHVRDLLPGRTALDLEHRARDGPIGVALGGGQQLGDPGAQRVDAGAGDRRAEVDRVHQRPPGLRRRARVRSRR